MRANMVMRRTTTDCQFAKRGHLRLHGGSGGVDYSITDAGALNIGQWHHVAIQRTNDSFLVYIDGEDVTGQAASSLTTITKLRSKPTVRGGL